jgi:hypothetical protein
MYTSCCSGPAVGAFHQAAEEESCLGLSIACSLDSLSASDNRQEQGSCFQVCFRLKPRKG